MDIVDKIEDILNENKYIDFTKSQEIWDLSTNLNNISHELKDLKKNRIKFRPNDDLDKQIGIKHKERNLAHRKLQDYINKLMED